MDLEIIRDLFDHGIQAAEILGVDQEFRAQVAATRARLAPLQIGSAGQLQEWLEDWDVTTWSGSRCPKSGMKAHSSATACWER